MPRFFVGVNAFHRDAPKAPATDSSFKGSVAWARKVLARPVTFRDCARCPVFTRLVNAMGAHDAARAVGVVPRTMDHYHVAQPDNVWVRAAVILAQRFYVQIGFACSQFK